MSIRRRKGGEDDPNGKKKAAYASAGINIRFGLFMLGLITMLGAMYLAYTYQAESEELAHMVRKLVKEKKKLQSQVKESETSSAADSGEIER